MSRTPARHQHRARQRRRLRVFASSWLGGLILAACQPQPVEVPVTVVVIVAGAPVVQYVTPTPSTPPPKVLIVCMLEEPKSLLPYADSSAASRAVGQAIWDGPIDARGFGYQPVTLQKLPDLADGDAVVRRVTVKDGQELVDTGLAVVPLAPGVEYWAFDANDPATPVKTQYAGKAGSVDTTQLVVTFKNKPGLTWSDGEPIKAEDMRLAYETYTALDSRGRYISDRTASYRTPDDQTAIWSGKPGFRDALYFTEFFGYWPYHRYGASTPEQQLADKEVNHRPLGWGAFEVADWVEGDHILLDRNEYYFRREDGLPFLDQVIFRFVEGVDQLLAQLIGGQCDLAPPERELEARTAFLLQAEVEGLLSLRFSTGTTLEHLDFNLTPDPSYGGLAALRNPDGRPMFQDVRVRQAFAYCLDRQKLIETLVYGHSESPPVYVPTTHPFYDQQDLATYGFDPARGRALLAEAGWTDSDGDGTLDRGGLKLSMNYYTGPAGNTLREQTAEFVKEQLRVNCGINIEVSVLPRPDLFAGYNDGGYLFGRKYDLAEFGWLVGPIPACEVYLSRELPSAAFSDGSNDVGYQSTAFDQACEAALATLDSAAQRTGHHQATVIFSQDLPSVMLFFRTEVAAARPEVQGFAPDATNGSGLWNVEAIDLAR